MLTSRLARCLSAHMPAPMLALSSDSGEVVVSAVSGRGHRSPEGLFTGGMRGRGHDTSE